MCVTIHRVAAAVMRTILAVVVSSKTVVVRITSVPAQEPISEACPVSTCAAAVPVSRAARNKPASVVLMFIALTDYQVISYLDRQFSRKVTGFSKKAYVFVIYTQLWNVELLAGLKHILMGRP